MKSVILAALTLLSANAFATDSVFDTQGVEHFKGYRKDLQAEGPSNAHYYAPSKEEVDALPVKYDARTEGFVSPIKDQGQCGSCWDFSETKTLESARLVAGVPFADLAEQDPLTNDSSNYGCNGGMMDAGYWVKHGLALTKDCRYTANDRDRCNAAPFDKGLAWGFVGAQGRAPTEDELKAAIYKYKVISITVAAGGSDWSGGNNGHMTDCSNTGIDHMVNLVGYDCTQSEIVGTSIFCRWFPWACKSPVPPTPSKACTFIGANSWGKDWGDKGFFYATQGCNQMASDTDSALWISYQPK